jgi:atypical dual specificity phosphatase
MFRKIQGIFTRAPPNFSWFMENVAASGIPSRRRHMRRLKKEGVTAVLTLTERPLPRELYDGEGIKMLHIPLRNHEPPPPEILLKAVRYLDELLESGEKVLVHCIAGLGRTGTVLAGYLIYKSGMGYLEAVETVRRLRPGSIEDVQVEALMRFESFIRAGS